MLKSGYKGSLAEKNSEKILLVQVPAVKWSEYVLQVLVQADGRVVLVYVGHVSTSKPCTILYIHPLVNLHKWREQANNQNQRQETYVDF